MPLGLVQSDAGDVSRYNRFRIVRLPHLPVPETLQCDCFWLKSVHTYQLQQHSTTTNLACENADAETRVYRPPNTNETLRRTGSTSTSPLKLAPKLPPINIMHPLSSPRLIPLLLHIHLTLSQSVAISPTTIHFFPRTSCNRGTSLSYTTVADLYDDNTCHTTPVGTEALYIDGIAEGCAGMSI